MTMLSGLILAAAVQTSPVEGLPPTPPPPVDKLACILATLAARDEPGAPLTMFSYFESGLVRIERELPVTQSGRNVDDLILQMDAIWYAQGRASINQGSPSGENPTMGAAPILQINLDTGFAQALTMAKTLSLWDENGQREKYDLKNIDRSTIDSWHKCVADAPASTTTNASYSSRYRAQAASQVVTPLNRPSWITSGDYPSRSLRQEISGTVTYTLSVGVNGRTKSCTTDNASPIDADGTMNFMTDLNEATCKHIRRRARFLPATDESGRPLESYFTGRVRWELPG